MSRFLTLTLALLTTACHAADWPQFRGPSGNGIADGASIPASWDESTNIAWAINIPGDGWSAPIVVGEQVFVTTAVPAEGDRLSFEVHCYRLNDGSPVWKRVAKVAAPSEPTHRDNTYASETPVSDGERVYAYFGMNGLFCYGLSGELVWSKDLGAYPLNNNWGTSSSPAIAEGRLFLQLDNRQESHLVALNADDGSLAWRAERSDEPTNWSTPLVWRNSKRTELIAGGKTIRSYDPASGEEFWSLPLGGRSSATAAAVGDTLYIGSENRTSRGGTPGGLCAVSAGATGEIDVFDESADEQGLLWFNVRGAIGISSPLVYEGHIYVPERRGGVLRVHDAATGEESYRTRLPAGGVFWASPIGVNGRVCLLDEKGKAFFLAPGPEYKLLGDSSLPGRFWSTPALADDSLLIRSADRLYCIRTAEGG